MACEIVYVYNDNGDRIKKNLIGRKCSSHVVAARLLSKDEQCVVQETSGQWVGWYRNIGISDDGESYWKSRPQMEY